MFGQTASSKHDCLSIMPSYKGALEGQAGSNSECWFQAAEDGSQQHQLSDADVHGETGQMPPQRSQTFILCQSTKSTQPLLGCFQAAPCWGLNETREYRVQGTLREHLQHFNPEIEEQSGYSTDIRTRKQSITA